METEIIVPDLGDVKDLLVTEISVKPGETIATEQVIAIVESDKATIDIPSPIAGIVASVAVSIGDRVSQGSLLAMVQTSAAEKPALTREPKALAVSNGDEQQFDLVVIGGGPGGYSAAFRAADLGMNVALVEREEALGGICLNVGCIPSKALLHVAAAKEEAERLAKQGIRFGAPELDLDALRTFQHKTVARLTGGLAQMAKHRTVHRITGTGRFAGPNLFHVEDKEGNVSAIGFRNCIIAVGSSPIRLPFLPDDPRIVDSTGALELPFIPQRMLAIGGGIIGLELATVYSALGTRVDVVEQMDDILAGVDRDLVAIWMKRNSHRFDRVMLSTRLESVEAAQEGIVAQFSNGHEPATYDLILQAVGRRPNGDQLSLEAAELQSNGGFIAVDSQMRTTQPHIFAIGDVVGQPMLAHKAVHQGHVAAEVAAGHKAAFEPLVIPSVAYVDPEIAWVGLTEDVAKQKGIEVDVAKFPWAASGRAIANGADYGMTKLLFSCETGRLVGGAIIGRCAGDMLGEICLAIELGADAADIGRTIHPHPTFGETIGMAAEAAAGTCTDLLPARKQNQPRVHTERSRST